MECELICCFSDEHGMCIATEDDFKSEEAALIANGYCGFPDDECPIYQSLVPPPWEQ